jgi:hypothetical protein
VLFNGFQTRLCNLLFTSTKSFQISFTLIDNAAFRPILSGLF